MKFVCQFILFGLLSRCCVALQADNKIVVENLQQGTRDWWHAQNNNFNMLLEGFTTKFSYTANQTVSFKVKVHRSIKSYSITVYRLGYYKGDGARQVGNISVSGMISAGQPPCLFDSVTRMTDCANWQVTSSWQIPHHAVSGVYIALPSASLQNKDGVIEKHFGGYIPFVVRQPANSVGSDVLFKTADLTWVAYNLYGGYNVYKSKTDKSFSARAFQASYNRPFNNRLAYPHGQHQNFLFGSEYALLRWLEKHGYDVSYAGCADFEEMHDAQLITPERFRAVLSVGHDEYWTQGLMDGFLSARDRGVSLAFLSGNEAFWRVRWAASSTEDSSHRTVVCHKESIENIAPSSPDQWTGTFMDPRHRVAQPQNALTGQLFMVNGMQRDALEVHREDMRLRFWRNAPFVASSHNGTAGSRGAGVTTHSNAVNAHAGGTHNRRASHLPVYTSPAGYLGYEFDVFVDDCHRPEGLFTLSHSRRNMTHSLLEDFGAAYKGSGVVSHKLSMYRHVVRNVSDGSLSDMDRPTRSLSREELTKIVSNTCSQPFITASAQYSALAVSSEEPLSSLVFGAGTIQWSWGLSAFHDGDTEVDGVYLLNHTVPVDPNIQQATLNFLADMHVLPAPFSTMDEESTRHTSLHFPSASRDFTPPQSRIQFNRAWGMGLQVNRRSVLHLQGSAKDFGGGRVAAVEVSLNGGKNWHLAVGRDRWQLTAKLVHSSYAEHRGIGSHNCSVMNSNSKSDCSASEQFRDLLIRRGDLFDEYSSHLYQFDLDTPPPRRMRLVVVSRAVDDSGWKEAIPFDQIHCALMGNDTQNALLTFSNVAVIDVTLRSGVVK